jgi:GNAT superfamily N-acetyltransferase
MRFVPVSTELPHGFAALRAEAAAEGFIHIERLWDEWQSGANRFTRPGEQLIAAWSDSELAGVGGITHCHTLPDALRMRRFYIRPAFRRHGIGRGLALTLLAGARPLGKDITLHAPYPASAAFWEAMGFEPDDREGHTHILRADDTSPTLT